MIIVEKNSEGKISNVGRKFALEQINSLTTEAMAAGFGATIRELEAQIDAFVPVPQSEEATTNETKTKSQAPAKKAAVPAA